MVMRGTKEIERRVAFALARSFHEIAYLKWTELSQDYAGKKSSAKLELDIRNENSFLIVSDYKGSALLKLDSSPFWSLDSYHKSVRLPIGKHELLAEFTPFRAFGEKTEIFTGTPILGVMNKDAYKFWIYSSSILSLAKLTREKELSEELLDLLSLALKETPFEGVTRLQLIVASCLSDSFPRELLEVVPDANLAVEGLGYGYEADSGKWSRGIALIEDGLKQLIQKFGKRGEILGVAHGHIDTAWLWPLGETQEKVARTFAVTATLLQDFKFHYVQSAALYYEWTRKNHPQLYERVKQQVEQGNWELGIGWVENDANIPSGESFARHFLYSQRYYLKEFGKLARVYWLPDTFGFAASIPQVARLGGAELFCTQKVFWNDTNAFPFSLFSWIGIDGTSLPSIAFGHSRDGYNSTFSLDELIEQWINWTDKDAPMLYSFGYGDGGGGPSEEMLLRAEVTDKLPSLPKVVFSPNSLQSNYGPHFAKLRNSWRGELYAEFHRGVLTSHTKVKMLNRKAELCLREAELWSTVLRQESPTYHFVPTREIERLWKIVLKNQFHDILPGSAIAEVYDTTYKELEEVVNKTNEIANDCLKEIIHLKREGGIVIFNSLPWMREECISLNGDDRNATTSQKVEGGYLAMVRVPPIGYASLDEEKFSVESKVTVKEEAQGITIENRFLKIAIDSSDGTVQTIFDKDANREILRERSNVFTFYENIPGWADAWDIEKGYKVTSFGAPELANLKVIERGPLRIRVKAIRKDFRHSRIEQEISLYADSRRIEFHTKVDMHDRELLLKVWFHFDINSDKATFEIPFGNIERPTTTNTLWQQAQFEVPMQKWADFSEEGYGVAILNNGRYGIASERGSFGISVVRTPIYPDYSTDSAEPSEFAFSLYPHIGGWREAGVVQKAYELNVPLRVVQCEEERDTEQKRITGQSFIKIDSTNIMLESLKTPENNERDSIILRLYEMHNRRGIAQLDLWKKIKDAERLDILELAEEEDKRIKVTENQLAIPYRGYEILTVKVTF